MSLKIETYHCMRVSIPWENENDKADVVAQFQYAPDSPGRANVSFDDGKTWVPAAVAYKAVMAFKDRHPFDI